MQSREVNPIQDLFSDIKKIIEFIDVKDQKEALKYETTEIHDDAQMWMGAIQEQDTYLTYRMYWNISMFQEILPNVKFTNVQHWIENPHNVPLDFRDNLLKRGREAFLNQYEEKNTYYRMLSGLPPIDETEFIYPSEELRKQLNVDADIPVHELSILLQNRYMSTDEYKNVLSENPDKGYLKYLGIYKVDILVARKARDFELIRYLPINRSDINPNLLKEFGSLYNDYRDYVMRVLYNSHLEDLYENYRTFMKLLIQCFVLMQISNKALEGTQSRKFLDDNVLHIILSMYGIPKSLLMTKEVRRELVTNLLKLTREKGTNQVYYDLVNILGYQDVIIRKLMLMRGQEFAEDGQTTFADGTSLTSFDDIDKLTSVDSSTKEVYKKLKTDPYFLAIDLNDENPYDTIVNGNAPIYSYESITGPDPTWWDLDDTQDILRNSNYSIADSKYITVEAVIHQVEFLFESIYFTRLILDNKKYTDTFEINIPEIFGTEPVSVYDLMVFLIAATCMNHGMTGEIITPDKGLFATAGFNFDVDLNLFQAYLDTAKYVDKEKIMIFMENFSMNTSSDINRLFNDVIYPMREWLENKISQSESRYELIEYENVYRALFTYDVARNSFIDDFESPMETIRKKYGLTEEDMRMYQHFYPRLYTGEAVTLSNYHQSRYYPFEATWIIDVPFKGRLYLHDVLNSEDVRYIKIKSDEDNAGQYIFMDEYDDGNGNKTYNLDRDAIRDVLEAINNLSDDDLKKAEFRFDTPILNSNGQIYVAGEKLPAAIRTGIFKQILIDKITMDIDGLAYPPSTYLEYLYRKNNNLYKLLTDNNRFEYDKELWLQDVMTIVLALETELNIHLKHFEQSVVGTELFFKPLITLIKHFKSTLVNFAKTGLRYVFGDKIDAGGNSNMLKLFDYMATTIQFVLLSKRGHESQFGLYDTVNKTIHNIIMKDRSELIRLGKEQDISSRRSWMGSIRMVDEMKFFLNGDPLDPSDHYSSFYVGEHGTGRWSQDDDIIMRTRIGTANIKNLPVDTEAWKNFVESHNY